LMSYTNYISALMPGEPDMALYLVETASNNNILLDETRQQVWSGNPFRVVELEAKTS
jgi:hypothetical protein